MPYLIHADYRAQIQDANLNQIISNDQTVLTKAELAAQAEAISYLRQKYDVSTEFADLLPWSNAQAYKANDRVYLDAPAYVAANTYNIGDLVLQTGLIYRCKVNGTTGVFAAANFDLLGPQYTIFSAIFPFPVFDYGGYYNVGDKVYWKGYVYTCLVQTPLLGHDTGIQYYRIENLPLRNIAPDDTTDGPTYWGQKTAYTIPAATLPTNTQYWSRTDNRDQQMVLYFVDLALYHVHSRIAPRNIPDLRVKRYDDAIAWLKMCALGQITPNLPLIQPAQGARIRFGGNIKQINSY